MTSYTETQQVLLLLGVTLGVQLILIIALTALWYELRAARLRIKLETSMMAVDTVFLRARHSVRRALESAAARLEEDEPKHE